MTPQEKNQLELANPEEATLPQLMEAQERGRFLESLIILARWKSFILYFTAGAALLAVLYSVLVMHTYYAATAKILPPQQGQSIASAMLGELGQLGGLISAAGGGGLGVRNISDVYVAMLRSRTVEDRLIDRFSLMKVYDLSLRVDAEKVLAGLSEIAASKEGVITVSVEDRDKGRAAEIANAYVEELEKLTKTLAVTDASKRRIFFEREAETASEELATAEQNLKKTQEALGVFQLESQAKVMLEAYAELQAEATAKQVEIQAMRSFATPENPDLVRREQELAALRAQMTRYEQGPGGRPIEDIAVEKLPAKALEYVRKLREVKYREALWQLLIKQYEAARIDEGKDAALIQTLDKAVPPERKSRPHRGIICIAVTLLAFLLSCVWAYFKESVNRAKEDPQYLARLQLLKFYLSRRSKVEDIGA